MATASVENEIANQVTIEDVGPARKRITVTIPREAVDARLTDSLETLAAGAALPGFRKGKAPRSLLEKRFGTQLRQETKSQLISSAYARALEEHKIRPVSEPELDESTRTAELEPGKPLVFNVDVEVVPAFELPSTEGLAVKRPVVDITDEHIDLEVKRNQFRFGTPARIPGPFEAFDRMLCRATAWKNDEAEPFFTAPESLVVFPAKEDEGRGAVLGLLIEDLESALTDKKVGDTIEITTTGPEGHEREDLRGAKLRIVLEIIDAERIATIPIPELLIRFGLPDEATMREQVRMALESRRDREQKAAMHEQIAEHLLEAVEFPLPEKLSEAQLTRQIERQRMELLYQGVEPAEIEARLAALRDSSEDQNRSRLKLFFLLQSLAEHFDVQVTEGEVNGLITGLARQRGQRPEQLRNELARGGRLGEVALQIREYKTFDRILDKTTITDVPATEWNALIQAKQQEKQHAAATEAAPAEKAPAKRTKKKST